MKVSKIALAAAMMFGGSATLFATAADAQRAPRGDSKKVQPPQVQNVPGQRQFELSKSERAALAPLSQAVEKQDWAAAQAALPAAQAAAQSSDAKYIVGQLQLRIGLQTQNRALQAQAIDALLASGGAQPDEMRPLLNNQAALAIESNNLQKAESALARLAEMSPNDPAATASLAELKVRQNKPAEAVTLLQRAIQVQEQAGQRPPESWYKRALAIAYQGRMVPQSLALSRSLLAAYPTPVNWRDSLLIYRDLARPDGPTNLDLLRLMRTTQSLSGERDYQELAEALNQAGLPGESKAVLDEGTSRRAIDGGKPAFRELITLANSRIAQDRASLPGLQRKAMAASGGRDALSTGDAFFGYGRYAEAAALYRAAVEKGGVDANLANTRLGMALALAGQRAEAEAAFRAVTGPRQELANFWLVWLNQRPA